MCKVNPVPRIIMMSTVWLLLSACQQNPTTTVQASLYSLESGTELVLHQDMIMPPNKARIYIQHGVMTDTSKINHYLPWCEFEVKTLHDASSIVHADTFQVQKLVNERSGPMEDSVMNAFGNPLEEFSSVLYLHSTQQPDVLRLTCSQRRGSRMQTYLSLKNIQSALGNIISINNK